MTKYQTALKKAVKAAREEAERLENTLKLAENVAGSLNREEAISWFEQITGAMQEGRLAVRQAFSDGLADALREKELVRLLVTAAGYTEADIPKAAEAMRQAKQIAKDLAASRGTTVGEELNAVEPRVARALRTEV